VDIRTLSSSRRDIHFWPEGKGSLSSRVASSRQSFNNPQGAQVVRGQGAPRRSCLRQRGVGGTQWSGLLCGL